MTFPEYDPDDDEDDPPLHVLETPEIIIRVYSTYVSSVLTDRPRYKINVLRDTDGTLPTISKDAQGNHWLDWGASKRIEEVEGVEGVEGIGAIQRVKINAVSVITEFCWTHTRLIYNGDLTWHVEIR